MSIPTIANALIIRVQALRLTDCAADKEAQPLIDLLVEGGHLPSNDCFIEWAGVHEFGLIPIFRGDGQITQVNSNGEVEQFH